PVQIQIGSIFHPPSAPERWNDRSPRWSPWAAPLRKCTAPATWRRCRRRSTYVADKGDARKHSHIQCSDDHEEPTCFASWKTSLSMVNRMYDEMPNSSRQSSSNFACSNEPSMSE